MFFPILIFVKSNDPWDVATFKPWVTLGNVLNKMHRGTLDHYAHQIS